MPRLRPAGYRILVEVIQEKNEVLEAEKKYGIAIPSHVKEKELTASTTSTEKGIVVDMGKFAYADDKEPWVKIGQTVYFIRHQGKAIEHEGKHYRLLNDEDVCGYMED